MNDSFRNVIKEDTILVVDADKGRVRSSFGSGLFYMPHGLKIDQEGNTWVTDVGLHQVMKFERGQTKPSLGMYKRAHSRFVHNNMTKNCSSWNPIHTWK